MPAPNPLRQQAVGGPVHIDALLLQGARNLDLVPVLPEPGVAGCRAQHMALNLCARIGKAEVLPGRPVKEQMPFDLGMSVKELLQDAEGVPSGALEFARNQPAHIDANAQG
ncbi:MAG: hypothetical protein EBZ22_03480 [Flavobacteriia bacterium]|nr:hypothetical protein [Flavobacteriia bacterium]